LSDQPCIKSDTDPTGTGREHDIVVTETLRIERRKEHRQVHVDRRKTAIDVIEHVLSGLRWERTPTANHHQPRRPFPRK